MARILLVDDDIVQIRVITNILEKAGYVVCSASSCAQALSLAQHQSFSLVLLDFYLPDGDAPSCAMRLRSVPSLRELPIIVITASPDDAELAASFQAGVSDFIRKPARALELNARVSNALRLYEAQLALAQSERASTLGQLAACVAHEINSPLAAVMSALQAIEMDLAPDERERLLALTRQGLARIQSMVADLRQFGRGDECMTEGVDLADSVRTALRMVSFRLCGTVRLEARIESTPGVACHPSLFSQVVVSLLSQAIDRLEAAGGGALTVELDTDRGCASLLIAGGPESACGTQRLTWGLAERTLRLFGAELTSEEAGAARIVFPSPYALNVA